MYIDDTVCEASLRGTRESKALHINDVITTFRLHVGTLYIHCMYVHSLRPVVVQYDHADDISSKGWICYDPFETCLLFFLNLSKSYMQTKE